MGFDQAHEVLPHLFFVFPARRDLTPCRSVLVERRTARRSAIDRACWTCPMHARRRAGSVVSPCRFLQDELVEGEVRDGLPQPGILKLQLLQPLHLVQLQAAVLLPLPVIRHLRHPDLLDRFGSRNSLRNKDIYVPQLSDDLSGVCFFLGMF